MSALSPLALAAERLMLVRHVDFFLREVGLRSFTAQRQRRVIKVIDESPDVKTFVFGGPRGRHVAGQYVPVDVEIDGVRVRRCYSISSAPGERLAITVKRVDGGRVSSFLHDRVAPGSTLGVGDPLGDFVLPKDQPAKLLLLTGGSGATPAISIVRDLAKRHALADVVYVHAARSDRDALFLDELCALESAHSGLRVHFRFDDETEGHLDESALRALVPDLDERHALLCGPEAMMRSLAPIWKARPSAWQRERFASPPRAITGTNAKAKVHLAITGRTIATNGATLLEALEAAGEAPKHGCRVGVCGQCLTRKRSGAVVDGRTGETSTEPDEDLRLCVSTAGGDLELEC